MHNVSVVIHTITPDGWGKELRTERTHRKENLCHLLGVWQVYASLMLSQKSWSEQKVTWAAHQVDEWIRIQHCYPSILCSLCCSVNAFGNTLPVVRPRPCIYTLEVCINREMLCVNMGIGQLWCCVPEDRIRWEICSI